MWHLRVRLLDSGYEWSYSHLLSIAAVAVAVLVCAHAAADARAPRPAWTVAAALLGVLLIDNVTRLHEAVPAWPVVYGPVLAALGLAILAAVSGTHGARLAQLGVVLLGVSFAIHMFERQVLRLFGGDPASWGWGHHIQVAAKEGIELAGWVLVVPALAMASAERAPRARRASPARRTR